MTSYFNVCDVTMANLNHKNVLYIFDVHLCPPHFEKGSATISSWISHVIFDDVSWVAVTRLKLPRGLINIFVDISKIKREGTR